MRFWEEGHDASLEGVKKGPCVGEEVVEAGCEVEDEVGDGGCDLDCAGGDAVVAGSFRPGESVDGAAYLLGGEGLEGGR